MLSLDLGKEVSIAVWNKDNKVVKIVRYSFDEKKYLFQNVYKFIEEIARLMDETKDFRLCTERPGNNLYIQWFEYMDLKAFCENNKIEFKSFVPLHHRKVVTGNGRADQDQVLRSVLSYNVVDDEVQLKDEHQLDSVCVGICFLKETSSKTTL